MISNINDQLYIESYTDFELELLALWKELLGDENVNVDDDFFTIGGTSLIAAQLFTEISRKYKLRLPYTTILDAPTVRKLADFINSHKIGEKNIFVNLKSGDNGTLFLVHDGFGETLLYRNLVSRMPARLSVIGIEPKSAPGIPIAHTNLNDMAAFYVNAIREQRPNGPYLIGGLCAGGVLAYLVAEKLAELNEPVQAVIVLDAAAPQEHMKANIEMVRSMTRLQSMINSAYELNPSTLARWSYIANIMVKKATNLFLWQLKLHSRKLLFFVLEVVLRYDLPWPKFIPTLTALDIYLYARSKYLPTPHSDIKVLLVRATEAKIKNTYDDIPCREMYSDEALGWHACTNQIEIIDVDGGHSSILQEPYVELLANKLCDFFRKEGLKFE